MQSWLKTFLLLFVSTLAWGTATVTGRVSTPATGVASGSNFVNFELQGCGNNPAHATQVGEAATLTSTAGFRIDASGNIKAADGVSAAAIVRNDQISCGGVTTSTFYLVTIFINNSPIAGQPQKYRITAGTFDLNSATPITVNPVVIAPTGDSTYFRKDGGNPSATGNTDMGGFSVINNPDKNNQVVNVKAYGAVGDGIADDYPAFAAAQTALASGGGIIYAPSGVYLFTSSGLPLKKGVHLECQSIHSTIIINATGGTVPVLVSGTSGAGGGLEIAHCQFQVRNASDIAIQLKGVDHSSVHDNLFHHPTAGVGTDIQLDKNGIAGAYTHNIYRNNSDNGGAIGIEFKGGVTTTKITANHLFATNPVVHTSGSNGGNVYTDNTLVCSTVGAGTAIGLNSTAAAEDFKGNYFEDCLNGINVPSGSTNHHASNNHWDNVTNHIVDGNTPTIGFSGIVDAEDGYLALGSSAHPRKISLTGDGQGASPPAVSLIDTHAAGKSYTMSAGTSAIGDWSLKNDTTATTPIKVNGTTDAVTLNGGLSIANGTTLATSNQTTGVGTSSPTNIVLNSAMPLSATSGTITPGALGADVCTAATVVAVTGATTSMAATATPIGVDIGDSNYARAWVSSAGNVSIKVCTTTANTPNAATYAVRVTQ